MTATQQPMRIAPPQPTPVATGRRRAMHAAHRSMRWFEIVLPWVLVGYALFDKGFAYIRIPGIPIFAGELMMLIGITFAVVATGYFRRGFQHSTVAKLILVFAAFGFLRTVPNLEADGINAVRDAALWYYALLAIPICALMLYDEDLIARWAHNYRRFIPWLLGYAPIALLLSKAGDHGLSPLVPGSIISIWTHEVGNLAVQVTMALAFIWLVPDVGGRFRPLLTGLATGVLVVGATQNRGGLVASAVGLFLVWVFAKRRGRMTMVMIATLVFALIIGWGLNIEVSGQQGRRVSVGQLFANITSLTGGGSNAAGNLNSNVQFRNELWSAVIKKVEQKNVVMTGLGFGPNVAAEVGFAGVRKDPLRSPHNSHVDVFARMGLIGAGLWLALWTAWYAMTLRSRKRLRAVGKRMEAAIAEVAIVGVTITLINAYFDPTLESPQVAVWLWAVVGITLGLAAIARKSTLATPTATDQQLVRA